VNYASAFVQTGCDTLQYHLLAVPDRYTPPGIAAPVARAASLRMAIANLSVSRAGHLEEHIPLPGRIPPTAAGIEEISVHPGSLTTTPAGLKMGLAEGTPHRTI
jgi:hypothetical protein